MWQSTLFCKLASEPTQVDVRVELAATAPVQGVYSCRLAASIAGPAAVKELRHEYEAVGPVEPPLAASDLRWPLRIMWPHSTCMTNASLDRDSTHAWQHD
jgi:hypothetical protein